MTKSKKIILILGVLALFGISIWLFGGKDKSADTTTGVNSKKIKIGFIAPLTGERKSYGQAVRDGVILAKKDLGADNIEVFFEDTQCDPILATNAMDKLVKIINVKAVIGDICSGATLAAAPLANQNKIVLISPGSTSPEITSAGEYIFRTIQSDAFQGKFGADLVYQNGGRRLAIIYTDESYGQGFQIILSSYFKGNIVSIQRIDQDGGDIRVQLLKLKTTNPDTIYIVTNGSRIGGGVIKQIRDIGITAKLYGSEGLKGDDLFDLAGDAAEGLIVTSISFGTDALQKRFLKEYDSLPGIFVAQGYDAFTALYEAVKAGASTGEEIKNEFARIKFSGVSGDIIFDSNGDVQSDYSIYEVQGRAFILQ
ncbi:MAG: ABC transporter substrate-binding protein [bacterium]|nr:ABC transporter substrate-binding protein [bacterium]